MTNAASMDASILWDGQAKLGEGPLWDEREQALYFVDIPERQVLRITASGEETGRWDVEAQVTSLVKTAGDDLLVTTRHGLGLFNDGVVRPLASLETEPVTNRCNDGKLDRMGRFWFGTMDENEKRASGSLFCFDRRGEILLKDQHYTIANGPAFSLDGTTMFHADSYRGTIYAYAVDGDGELSNRRVFAQFDTAADGAPDGMTVDADDGLWVCHFGGSRVTRFSPNGQVLAVVRLPVPNVTSCTFGGVDQSTMFITTARVGIDPDRVRHYPQAGGVFVATPGVQGVIEGRYSSGEPTPTND